MALHARFGLILDLIYKIKSRVVPRQEARGEYFLAEWRTITLRALIWLRELLDLQQVDATTTLLDLN